MSPRSTLAQQWQTALTTDEPGQFTVWRRVGTNMAQVAGPFDWILSMLQPRGAQEQAAMFNLQLTHRATVFDAGIAALQAEDQVKHVATGRVYQVKRIEGGFAVGGGTLYLSEVKGS